MPFYRRLPVLVEARQWLPCDPLAAGQMAGWLLAGGVNFSHPAGLGETTTLAIQTLEGEMTARPGDWIVRGTAGEAWPVRADIFAKTYERAEDGES